MAVRHHNWTHVHVVGDRDQASAYLPEARKLLGQVIEDAQHNGLQTHQMTRRYQDGAVIVAEVRGGIPRVTITPPAREGEDPRPEPPDDFVVWARALGLDDGIDPVHPQQILKSPGRAWRPYVFNDDVPLGYREGTYAGIFPRGLRHAGNIDWKGASGVRLSWYGPSARTFLDAYVNTDRIYGRRVFCMGQVLLDTDEYADEAPEQDHPRRYVLGAGIHEASGQLLVVQSTTGEGYTDLSPIPQQTLRVADPMVYHEDTRISVYSYQLEVEPDAAGVQRYRVVPGSRVERAFLDSGYREPWFFNEDGSEAVVHYTVPENTVPGQTMPWWASALIDRTNPAPSIDEQFPGWAQPRLRVALDEDLVASVLGWDSFSVVAGGASAPAVSEFDGAELAEYSIRFGDDLVPYFEFDGASVPLWSVKPHAEPAWYHGVKRWIRYASPRDKLVIFHVEDLVFRDAVDDGPNNTTRGQGATLEVWRYGQLVSSQQFLTPNEWAYGMPRVYTRNQLQFDSLRGRPVAPSYFLFGINLPYLFTGVVGANFVGANPTYATPLQPADHYFGTYDGLSWEIDRPATPIASLAKPGFNSNREDFDGQFSITGCAASGPHHLVSVAVPTEDGTRACAHASSQTLPEITGISGAGARYHPIWMLGKPPENPNA